MTEFLQMTCKYKNWSKEISGTLSRQYFKSAKLIYAPTAAAWKNFFKVTLICQAIKKQPHSKSVRLRKASLCMWWHCRPSLESSYMRLWQARRGSQGNLHVRNSNSTASALSGTLSSWHMVTIHHRRAAPLSSPSGAQPPLMAGDNVSNQSVLFEGG